MAARTISTDVLIVGSGAIGATYARLLKPHFKRVTVIDSGAQMSRIPGEHLLNRYIYQHMPNLSLGAMYGLNQLCSVPEFPYDLAYQDGTLFNPPVARRNHQNPRQNPNTNMPNAAECNVLGGAFAMWSCFAPSPVDFEMRPFVEQGLVSPQEWRTVLPLAHKLYNTHTDAFEPSALNRALGTVFQQKGYERPLENLPMGAEFRYQNERGYFVTWTSSDTILGPLLDPADPLSEGFEILPEHRAEKLEVEGHRIKSCRVRNLTTDELIEVHAEVFIIAANAFATPRLLWKSEIGSEALGRYLTENIIGTVTIGLNNDVIDALKADTDNPARDALVPIALNDPPPKSGFAPTEDMPWIGHINRTDRYLYYTEAKWDERLTLDLTFYGLVRPQASNRIVFEPGMEDRFGEPQITFEYRLGPEDAADAEKMMADLARVATSIGSYLPIQTSAASAKGVTHPFVQPAGTSWHWMGTYRMGSENDGTCVVDPESRVWGIDNLYLGGSGVIPSPVASNCTLMASGIAAKSAAAIAGTTVDRLAADIGVGR